MNNQMINAVLWDSFAAKVRKAQQQTNLKTIRELWKEFHTGGPFADFAKPIQLGKIKEQEFVEMMEQMALSGAFDQ